MEVSVVSGFGAYSNYPRGSVGEGLQAVHMSAAPYRLANFSGRLRGYFQNKPPSGVLRAVGQPIACTVTEQLLDLAARRLDIDPAEIRRRNYAPSGEKACTQRRRHRAERTVARSLPRPAAGADELRRAAPRAGASCARAASIAASGSRPSSSRPGSARSFTVRSDVRVSAHEACRLTLEPDGHVRCATSVTDQGQGTLTALARSSATTLGVDIDAVEIVTGDTAADAVRRRRLGLARHRARRRGGAPRRASTAAERSHDCRLAAAGGARRSAPRRRDDRQCRRHWRRLSLADVADSRAFHVAHRSRSTNLPPLDIAERFTSRDPALFRVERHPGRSCRSRSRVSAPSGCSTSGWSTIAAP